MADAFDVRSSGAWSYSAEASTVLKSTALAAARGGLGVRYARGANVKPKHDAKYAKHWARATAGFHACGCARKATHFVPEPAPVPVPDSGRDAARRIGETP